MANLNNFDANTVDPTTTFDPIPAGKYVAAITESEMKPTKNGNPPTSSPAEVSQMLQVHRDAIDFAVSNLPTVTSAQGINIATTRAVVARAYYTVDRSLLKDFCRKLTTGIVTSPDEAVIVALRLHLQANRGSSYSQRVQRYGKVQRVLSAWLRGENPSRIYPASIEQYPLPEEVKN